MNRVSKIVVAIFIIVFAVACVIFYMSTTLVEEVRVDGNYFTPRHEVLKLANISDTSSMLDVVISRITSVEDNGYIETLNVDKNDYRHITITVIEKEIIGYVEYMGKFICIDNSGYIVDYTDSPDVNKPVIVGIDLTVFTVDEPLDVSEDIVLAIDAIYRNGIAFDVPVEKVDFDYKSATDITIFTERLEIKIGDTSRIEEKFKAIHEVLVVLPEDKRGILYADSIDDDLIFKSY